MLKESPFPEFHPNDTVWILANFDIIKSFVKTEHRVFLRNVVVPTLNADKANAPHVRIIGEASTTAGPDINDPLSAARAKCTHAALLDAGLDPSIKVEPEIAKGESYAQVRRIFAGEAEWDSRRILRRGR